MSTRGKGATQPRRAKVLRRKKGAPLPNLWSRISELLRIQKTNHKPYPPRKEKALIGNSLKIFFSCIFFVSFLVPFDFPSCSLSVPFVLLSCSLRVSFAFPSRSLRCTFVFSYFFNFFSIPFPLPNVYLELWQENASSISGQYPSPSPDKEKTHEIHK